MRRGTERGFVVTDKKPERKTEFAEERTDWAEDRTLMANERTFAGWMRTGLASVGVGLAIQAIFKEAEPTWLAKGAATIFVLIGIFIFIAAYRTSAHTLDRLESHVSHPVGQDRLRWIVGFFIGGSAILGIVLWLL